MQRNKTQLRSVAAGRRASARLRRGGCAAAGVAHDAAAANAASAGWGSGLVCDGRRVYNRRSGARHWLQAACKRGVQGPNAQGNQAVLELARTAARPPTHLAAPPAHPASGLPWRWRAPCPTSPSRCRQEGGQGGGGGWAGGGVGWGDVGGESRGNKGCTCGKGVQAGAVHLGSARASLCIARRLPPPQKLTSRTSAWRSPWHPAGQRRPGGGVGRQRRRRQQAGRGGGGATAQFQLGLPLCTGASPWAPCLAAPWRPAWPSPAALGSAQGEWLSHLSDRGMALSAGAVGTAPSPGMPHCTSLPRAPHARSPPLRQRPR